jgi:hypothetical protein
MLFLRDGVGTSRCQRKVRVLKVAKWICSCCGSSSRDATQPATAIFRAIELPALIGHGIQQGLGIDIGCGDGKLTDIPANPTDWRARSVCSA